MYNEQESMPLKWNTEFPPDLENYSDVEKSPFNYKGVLIRLGDEVRKGHFSYEPTPTYKKRGGFDKYVGYHPEIHIDGRGTIYLRGDNHNIRWILKSDVDKYLLKLGE
jgi:hypothetical protein